MLSRRPLAAALRLAPLSPPLLLFFASSSSSSSSPASCSSPAASASGPRGCSALRMDTGAVEPASTGAIWSTPSVEPRSISIGKQIFCNRSLNMRNITAVGFDMDYTLAQYKPETFEALAYHGTIEKLVKDLNYPEELLTWQFDWKYMVRGLVLDKKRGNILKMDRHNYAHMYRDVRSAVDLCHRDGTLKRMVAKEPSRYINEDLAIVPMLQMLRKSGRSTFLVTNSLWDYTDVVMNYLCGPYMSDVSSSHNHKWLEYFDVVITGSSKPSFFHDDNRTGLFEVEPDSGKLLNADLQIGSPRSSQHQPKPIHKVYQGGNVGHLHRLLSVASSSQILYVGDHIYGDILRSKKVLGWRTMLVIPELEQEVKLQSESKSTRKELRHLRMERDSVEDTIHRLEWSLQFEDLTENEKGKLLSEHDNLLQKLKGIRCLLRDAQMQHHQKFHKVWGQLMKTGYQNSRFAHQVERFACLYCSQVTDFGLYSPNKYYRPSEDYMPHEFDVLGL
ncbi:unnamed protein product [Triticum turgidum subsp. durum]|uniref:5'-nucleotidase n=1 Tax=Triticum turgidum subsp. durum TaxID=4567 RepID=A0A9R0XIU8_TRITD|nr:unnamed protein product [Triticum turgidum subsp. durum]